MKIKLVDRYACFFIAVILNSFCQTSECAAEERNVMQWSYADMLQGKPGISVLRYGAPGFGAYPYGHILPQAGLKVRVDGVPLRSISPFGPDLEFIPFQFVESVKYNRLHELNIFTGNVTGDEPITVTNFLIGERRRFNVDMAYSRRFGEKSGIFFSGSSNGIHVRDKSDENSLRNYFMKYQRYLENGGTVNFSMQGLRDRDGLVDLDDNSITMGERKTDNVSVSLGLEKYPLGKRTTLSPVAYYQSSNSRFHKYGSRKSIDDNAAGLNMILTTERENTNYRLNVAHDTYFFDSRIHNVSWTRNETEIALSLMHENDNRRIMLNGGLMNSSKYGKGSNFEGEFALKVSPGHEFVVHGLRTDEFPDTGKEYYSSLVFSDSTFISELEKFDIAALEYGMRFSKERFNLGIFGFGSSSKLPLFRESSAVTDFSSEPFSSQSYMSSRKKTRGYRIFFDTHGEKTYHYDIKINLSQRIGSSGKKSDSHENWPYPSVELFSGTRFSRKLFDESLESVVFANSHFFRFDDGYSGPKGNFFFLNIGFVIKVSTLELFYKIENVTNEKMRWFNTMGWMERNAMWGGRWVFYN